MSTPTEKRTIKINPDLFKFSTTNTTRKKRDASLNPPKIKVKNDNSSTKTIKRNLLKYIRRHQDVLQKESSQNHELESGAFGSNDRSRRPQFFKPITTKEDKDLDVASHDFKDSLDYLLKLSKDLENRQQPPKNHTLKHRADTNIHDLFHSFNTNTATNESVSLEMPSQFSHIPIFQPVSSGELVPIPIKQFGNPIPDPVYGCLKNGKKPTYRNWKNHTQRVYPSVPSVSQNIVQHSIPIDPTQQRIQNIQQRAKITRVNQFASSPEPMSLRKPESQKLSDILKREQMKQMNLLKVPKKIKQPKRCQKTMRRTYRVGRSKIAPRISVLVSNKTIRKNISTQSQLLKQVPIKDVKQYLVKKGFIRIGSIAPNEVLRRMYETAKTMCGEVQKHNPENLLYNFLNGEGEH